MHAQSSKRGISVLREPHIQFSAIKTSAFYGSFFCLEKSLPEPDHFIPVAQWFSRPCCTHNRPDGEHDAKK